MACLRSAFVGLLAWRRLRACLDSCLILFSDIATGAGY
jgi:hypothetical protein